ncbi:MAG TPA: hypothetical protein VGG74_28020 [Kofleriaceae bacterium]|jgi:hypothetical protein
MNKALLALAFAFGCTTTNPEPKSTQLVVTIGSPSSLGDVNNRLDGSGSGNPVTISVQAYDENNCLENGSACAADGGPAPDYTTSLGVYTHYLGTLTPYLTGSPLTTINITHGQAMNQSFMLPPVYGPTTIWLDDDSSADPEFVAGTSPTIWFRDPFTADLQRPTNPASITALDVGPVDNKNITVNGSQFGSNGRLVVTSVFSQGFTVADVQCQDSAGTPPCMSTPYGFMDVFSYSAPQDQELRYIVEGEVIDGYAGGVSEFDGLTELGFPQSFVDEDTPDVNPAREPPAAVFDPSWLSNPIMFEQNESGMIEVDNTVVCPLDSDYTTYNEWKLDPSGQGTAAICGNDDDIIIVVTAGTVDIDPGMLVGKTLSRIVGNLRPINIGSFNAWIIYPRSMADITTQ